MFYFTWHDGVIGLSILTIIVGILPTLFFIFFLICALIDIKSQDNKNLDKPSDQIHNTFFWKGDK